MIIMDNDYKGPAVYQIKNEINNKIYIGSTKNYSKRISEHISKLELCNHDNKQLQADYNKGDAFRTDILKKLPEIFNQEIFKYELFYEEHIFIKQAKSEEKELYNITPMRDNYYISSKQLEKKLADISCKQIFGDTLERHLCNRPKAYSEVMFLLLDAKTEEEKENIINKYKPLLDYQSKDNYYRIRHNITYCDYLQLTEEERQALK